MPCRTRMRPPRFRTKDVSTCMGSPTARGSSIRKPFARGGCCLLVSELDRHLGIRPVSQLDTQPVVSPVNASRLPSRAETSCITRGRGGWLGLTPWKTCTSYPLPAFLAHSPSGQPRTGRGKLQVQPCPQCTDSVAKLWLRLRLDRDSVDQHCDSRGAVDDGAARVRTRSILLQV